MKKNGEISDQPFGIIAVDDAISCAQYAFENNLLATLGCKRFKPLTKQK